MTSNTNNENLLRLCWMLFADVNTRFNLLIDECAHLQNTIRAYLDETSNEQLGQELRQPGGGEEERGWVSKKIRSADYYSKSEKERSFCNLWNSVGSLVQGLQTAQSKVRNRFERLVTSSHQDFSGTELYWFLSIRGHFLHDAFHFYLKQIEHAHEKIVQLIENMPGTLPGPLLLRRWSSGSYVDFLAWYSRHVNWRTQKTLWLCTQGTDGDTSFSKFKEWRSSHFLTHTWAHVPTSFTRSHRVTLPREHSETTGTPHAFSFETIWSAYFYLEQPSLFPLLFHECAHHCVSDETLGAAKRDGVDNAQYRFIRMRRELAAILSRTSRFEPRDDRFWESFIDEVWADVLAIMLSGRGYIFALALQIIGHSGKDAFSRFNTEDDTLINLENFGDHSREVREVPWADLNPEYFWEARLRIAIEVYLRLNKAGDDQQSEWIAALKDLVERRWFDSGRPVFSSTATSQEHEDYWRFRQDLNDWVFRTIFGALDLCVPGVSSLLVHDTPFVIGGDERELISCIERAVGSYANDLFRAEKDEKVFCVNERVPIRLEDICVDVRWYLSKLVAKNLRDSRPEDYRTYTDSYASYVRNDGSSAFRLALEWILLRTDMYVYAAEHLYLLGEQKIGSRSLDVTEMRTGLARAVEKDFEEFCQAQKKVYCLKCNQDGEERRNAERACRKSIGEAILKKGHVDEKVFEKQFVFFSGKNLRNEVTERMKLALNRFETNTVGDGAQIAVGTLAFGLIRPKEIEETGKARDEQTSPLGATLAKVKGYYGRSFDILTDKLSVLTGVDDKQEVSRVLRKWGFKSGFLPLIGDYSFVHYVGGSTPAERDCHPVDTPRVLYKPRLVMRVLGNAEGMLETAEPAYSPCPIGRVAQISYPYRWQWLELAERLSGARYEKYQPTLFISSGWEDVILITWHETLEDLDELSEDLDLSPHEGIDIHTNIALRDMAGIQPTAYRYEGCEKVRDILTKHDNVPYLNWRTGRYDFTVVWGKEPSGEQGGRLPISVREFAGVLLGLPKEFWGEIGAITTSLETRLKYRGKSSRDSSQGKFEFVSHIQLRQ